MNMRCPTLHELPPPPLDKTGWPWTEEAPQLPEKMPDGSEWPKISVITATYNQEQFIEETIRTVLLQSYPNLEYIIVNDGSTDGTVEIIRKYEKFIASWVNQENSGQSNAMNRGFEESNGDILCWLNSDDLFKPEAFAFVAQTLRNTSVPAWFIGACEIINNQSRPLFTRLAGNITYATLLTFNESWFPQQSTFWTRPLWEIAGPLDENLYYVMDYDLWIPMFEAVKPMTFNKVLSAYRYHDESKGITDTSKVMREVDIVRKRYLKRISGDTSKLSRIKADLEERNLAKHIGEILLSWVHTSYSKEQYDEARQYLIAALHIYPPLRQDKTVFFLKLKLLLGTKMLNILRKVKHSTPLFQE